MVGLANGFRGAMRRLATTVSIVTTARDEDWLGMTMTAVTSVSVDPPALLICVNRSTRLHAALSAGAHFCVNMLRSGHEDVAAVFGAQVPAHERFSLGDWTRDGDEPPYLLDAQSNLFCDVSGALDHGSHTIFIGGVRRVRLMGEVSPLLYGDGAYFGLKSN